MYPAPEDYEVDERLTHDPEAKLPKVKQRTTTNYQWAVGVLFAIIIALGGWGLLSISQLQARTAAAEARIENTHTDVERVDNRLIRMEDKLDRIIEQGVQIRHDVRAVAPRPRSPQGP